jgi:hypothetical protein
VVGQRCYSGVIQVLFVYMYLGADAMGDGKCSLGRWSDGRVVDICAVSPSVYPTIAPRTSPIIQCITSQVHLKDTFYQLPRPSDSDGRAVIHFWTIQRQIGLLVRWPCVDR